MKYRIVVLILLIVLFPSIIHADTQDVYINDNEVIIPMETYNNLRKIYSEKALQLMEQEEYDKVMALGLDFSKVTKVDKYFKTSYNTMTGETTNEEVSYEDINLSLAPKTSSYIQTTYKRLELTVTAGTSTAMITESLKWLSFPVTRSYDVIGIRLSNASVVSGTQSGKQYYTQGGLNKQVSYAYNGTNISNQTYGFGISMNLVDPTVTYLENFVTCTVTFPTGNHIAFGSYQHAVNNVSLATSKNYTISSGGLGDVFIFNGTAGSNYDAMDGVYVRF